MSRISKSKSIVTFLVLLMAGGTTVGWLSGCFGQMAEKPDEDSAPAAMSIAAMPTTEPSAVPSAALDMNSTGQSVYEAARNSDWTAATAGLVSLKTDFARLKTAIAKPTAEQKKREGQINTDLGTLTKAVTGKQRQTAMLRANRILRLTGVVIATFNTKVPVDVSQLSYLAREMEVLAAANDQTGLKALPGRINGVWTKLKKQVVSIGAAAPARAFDDALAQVQAAKTPDDFAKAARPMLGALDGIAAAYTALKTPAAADKRANVEEAD